MQTTDYVTIQTTTDSCDEAERLASLAVEQQLAACVQVSQVHSFYRWQGETHRDQEYLLTLKTTSATVPGIKHLLAEQHSYDEPEMIVLPIIDGAAGYLDWIHDMTSE